MNVLDDIKSETSVKQKVGNSQERIKKGNGKKRERKKRKDTEKQKRKDLVKRKEMKKDTGRHLFVLRRDNNK